MSFQTIKPTEMQDNPFTLIAADTMLVTAKMGDQVNTMTIGWGGFGVLWGKNVVYMVVRPERYTHGLLEQAEGFSLTAFDRDERSREILRLCGTKSGRDMDKIAACDLNLAYDGEVPYFEEARLVMCCKKIYRSAIMPEFYCGGDGMMEKWYDGSYGAPHSVYIAEISKLMVRAE